MPSDASILFQPLQLGALTLPNRIVMAPLTRNRADRATDAPYELNARYYAQRASAGLLITEASQISREGQGYIWTPGIYTPEQIAGWRKVTDAVHAAGGRIVIQLWHVGRVSHTSLQENGAAPVAPSAIRAKAQTYIETGFADVSEPRALRLDEIPRVVADYERAARNAKEAGFDGIEIHAANGYLLDQFLSDASNRRTDAYGGSIENRSRLTLEVVEAVLRVWEPGRVGIRLSPGPTNDVVDSNPAPLFGYLVGELDKRKLAYIHLIEAPVEGLDYGDLRRAFRGVYIANGGYTRERAIEAIESGRVDAVAFGRPFIANPDLVQRLRLDAPLNEPARATFYGGGPEGYIDYPTLDRAA
ncbi:MAG: alkene reductase [Pseudomonadota bacterium]|nr:alkene reductase [Pseudomonadota bacterium]